MTRVQEWVFVFGRVAHANLLQIVELGPNIRAAPELWARIPAPVQALIVAGLP